MYWGLCLYFGNPVSQNGKGHYIGHVKRVDSYDQHAHNTRVYQMNTATGWHNDNCDIVGKAKNRLNRMRYFF